jgi:hypothetical protein
MAVQLRLESVGAIPLFHFAIVLYEHVFCIVVESSEAVCLKEWSLLTDQKVTVFIDAWSEGVLLLTDFLSDL